MSDQLLNTQQKQENVTRIRVDRDENMSIFFKCFNAVNCIKNIMKLAELFKNKLNFLQLEFY